MQFTTSIATAILAFTSLAVAAPRQHDRRAESGLSLTAQLQLADTAADRYALLPKNSDFVFDFNKPQPSPGEGGEVIAANRKAFPALVGSNIGMAVGRLEACGMNTLHVHPRSAEFQIVTEGRLMTEMVPENGVLNADGKRRVISTELKPYMATLFPAGSIHSQFNPDCEPAIFVASFASEDFGTGQIADETFALSDDLIAATFGQTIAGKDIDLVRAGIPKNIALGVDACLKKCGIKKREV